MTTTAARTRLTTAADVPVLTETIAAAFHDDPTMRWIVPDEERRLSVEQAVFRPFVEGIQRLGDTWMTEDGAGVALWIPPGCTVPAPEDAEAFEQQMAAVLHGSRLLEAVLPRLDRDGIPAYLEATTDRNRQLYERHGFVYWNDIAPEAGPVLRRMWREPR